jgi:hypothetical protein
MDNIKLGIIEDEYYIYIFSHFIFVHISIATSKNNMDNIKTCKIIMRKI